jgi:prenyltransferase beta subunit
VSLGLDMLRAAQRARGPLHGDAGRVAAYLRGRLRPGGGFPDRSGATDLYYTVFGLQSLVALGPAAGRSHGARPAAGRSHKARPAAEAGGGAAPSTVRYLRSFGVGARLDLVHLACLARCRSLAAPPGPAAATRKAILKRIETFRSADGGYHPSRGSPAGSAYACYLALGAWQDLGASPPDPEGLLGCLRELRTADGGYANERGIPFGVTPPTAAAACLLHELGRPVERATADWLLARGLPDGGFQAMPGAAAADLLSTATALHALALAGVGLDEKGRARCRDFVMGLLTEAGGFRGSAADAHADCEYTFYGLLALGHLAD